MKMLARAFDVGFGLTDIVGPNQVRSEMIKAAPWADTDIAVAKAARRFFSLIALAQRFSSLSPYGSSGPVNLATP